MITNISFFRGIYAFVRRSNLEVHVLDRQDVSDFPLYFSSLHPSYRTLGSILWKLLNSFFIGVRQFKHKLEKKKLCRKTVKFCRFIAIEPVWIFMMIVNSLNQHDFRWQVLHLFGVFLLLNFVVNQIKQSQFVLLFNL